MLHDQDKKCLDDSIWVAIARHTCAASRSLIERTQRARERSQMLIQVSQSVAPCLAHVSPE